MIAELITSGDISGIKATMAKTRELGMQTFDLALYDLYTGGKISYDDAIYHAYAQNDLSIMIKLDFKDKNEDNSIIEE